MKTMIRFLFKNIKFKQKQTDLSKNLPVLRTNLVNSKNFVFFKNRNTQKVNIILFFWGCFLIFEKMIIF